MLIYVSKSHPLDNKTRSAIFDADAAQFIVSLKSSSKLNPGKFNAPEIYHHEHTT